MKTVIPVSNAPHFQRVRTLADIDSRDAHLRWEEYFSGGRCWDGLNRYTYCHNNPVRYTDPTGHGDGDGDGNSEGGSNFGNAGTNSGGYHGTNTTGADTTSTGNTGTGTVSTEGDPTTTTTGGNGGGHTPGTTNGGHQPGTTSGGPSPGTTSGGPDDSKPKEPSAQNPPTAANAAVIIGTELNIGHPTAKHPNSRVPHAHDTEVNTDKNGVEWAKRSSEHRIDLTPDEEKIIEEMKQKGETKRYVPKAKPQEDSSDKRVALQLKVLEFELTAALGILTTISDVWNDAFPLQRSSDESLSGAAAAAYLWLSRLIY